MIVKKFILSFILLIFNALRIICKIYCIFYSNLFVYSKYITYLCNGMRGKPKPAKLIENSETRPKRGKVKALKYLPVLVFWLPDLVSG